MSTHFYSDPRFLAHSNSAGHPERPDRLMAVTEELKRRDLWSRLHHAAPKLATDEQLLRVHTSKHVALIREAGKDEPYSIDGDTSVEPGSHEAASLAVGAACDAVDSVMKREARNAFVCARPPGHHATPDTAMGFCLFNTISCAARHAQSQHGLERVAVLDWDVHHGNGTQDAFYEDPSVLFVSLHQAPLYPGTGWSEETGRGEGEGFTLNLPLRAGQGDEEYVAAWREIIGPRVTEFAPQMLLISAGYDAHQRDPLGGMKVSRDGFALMTLAAMRWADELCDGRLVLVLEGGYDLQGLSESVAATLEVLVDQ